MKLDQSDADICLLLDDRHKGCVPGCSRAITYYSMLVASPLCYERTRTATVTMKSGLVLLVLVGIVSYTNANECEGMAVVYAVEDL